MPNYLAIDLDERDIIGHEASDSKGRVQLRRGFHLQLPADLDSDEDAAAVGQWLRVELDRLGVESRQALISLPRSEAVVRPLELPDAPDNELPDMVRFQAAAKSSTPLDRMALDFLPLPPRLTGGDERAETLGRDVLVATIPRERIDELQAVLQAAGLEAVSVGISPVAAAEVIARAERKLGDDPEEPTLIVTRHGQRVEISLMRRQCLVFTHSTRLTGEDEQRDVQSVVIEINRTTVVMERTQPGFRIARVWVVGSEGEDDALFRALDERIRAPVRAFDPIADLGAEALGISGHGGQFAGPAGLLYARSEATVETIDFLAPRRKIDRTDPRKIQMGVAAAVAALLVIGTYAWFWNQERNLRADIATAETEQTSLSAAVRNAKPVLEASATFDDWEFRNVDGFSRLDELHEVMDGTRAIMLKEYRIDPGTGGKAAIIRAVGVARTREDVENLYAQLRQRKFEVEPKKIERTEEDAQYPWSVDLELSIPLSLAMAEFHAAKTPAKKVTGASRAGR